MADGLRTGARGGSPGVPEVLDRGAAIAWRVLVVGAAVWLTIIVLGRLRLVAIPLAFALFFTALLEPASTWLKRHRFPPAAAASLVLAVSIAALVAVFAVAGVRLVAQTRELVESFQQGWDRLIAWATDTFPISEEQIRSTVGSIGQAVGDDPGQVVFGGAATAAHVLVMAALTVIAIFFFLKDGDRMATWVTRHMPKDRHGRLRGVGAVTWTKLSSFARGQALIAVVDAVLTAIALVIIGVPAVLTLSLLTLVGGFVPLAGPVIAGAVAALVALSSGGPVEALWVVAAFVAIQQTEGNLLQPFVLGRAVQLHPLVVLLGVATGGVIGGVIGAFVAVPLTAAAVAAAAYLSREEVDEQSEPAGGDRAA